MKNIIGILLLLTVFSACSNENELPADKSDGEYITLGLNKQTLARVSEAGDDTYNENTIFNVDIFFYKNGTCVFYPENVTINQDNTVTIKVPSSELQLFDESPYTVYVIANGTFTREQLQSKTIAELKQLSTSTTFTADANNKFLMDGMSENISLTKNGSSGYIDLYRAAAKITLEVSVSNSVTGEDGITWTSIKDQMTISLCNGVNKTYVNTTDHSYTVNPNSDFFTTEGRGIIEGEKGHTPFYSYPNKWDTNPENETYLLLTVPWKNDNTNFQTYYYRIPINNQYKELVRNNLYKIKLNVSILGSSIKEKPVKLTPNYLILDWSTKEIPTDLKDFKYLVLDKNFVVMNNVNEISVGYSSSDPITTEIISITKPDYSNIEEGITIISSYSNFYLSVNNKMLNLKHDLNNNNSTKNYDFVPYTIKAKVYHTNRPEFIEYIEYLQYPALYIKADKNTGTNKGNVYVNKNNLVTTDWTVVNNIGGTSSINPNMYVITVSAFDNNSTYIIADPRSTTPLSPLGFVPKADSNSNILQYYYATQESEAFKNYISPQFRICSAYGRLGSVSLSKDEARYRCASYQEAGYSAGRWRVPTSAELEFMGKLCAENKIPSLFTDGNTYWSASGAYKYDKTNGRFNSTTSANYVRCVYDEWYWTDTCNKGTFTWGDKQR